MAKKGGGAVTQPFQSTGSTTGTTSGTTTGSTSATGTTTVNTPEGWLTNWQGMQPGAGGFNPTQQPAVDFMRGQLGSVTPGAGRAHLDLASGYLTDALRSRTAPTLANLEATGMGAYATPAQVQAQQIAARRGSEFMSEYQNPFQQQVIDASLGQFDVDAAEARNALRAGNAGAFGNKRYGVAEGQFGADTALGRASLGAGLRSQGFTTAAGLGMQDAGRFLTADQANAANALAASTFNNQQAQARQMFDANLGMAYNQQRDALAGQVANLGSADYALGQGLAGGLMNAGAMGAGQGLNWLNAAVPAFGQTTSQSGTQTGTQTGTQSGTTNQSGFQTSVNPSGGKGGVLGGLGSLAQGAAALAPLMCWVAREVYGAENPKWLEFRQWMLTKAPAWLRNAYIKYGERIALWLKDKPATKNVVRSWMDSRVKTMKGCV